MRLGPGDAWGATGVVPRDLAVAHSDAEAVGLIGQGHRIVGLAAGDLCRTLGGRGDVRDRRGREAILCPVDVGVAEVDDTSHLFLAHVVAAGRFGAGEGAAIMNAEWFGDFRLGPRAHPGDGLLDVTTGRLPFRARLQARRRSHTGDHVPHPALHMRRVEHVDLTFERPRLVRVDGVMLGRVCRLRARLRPEQVQVVV